MKGFKPTGYGPSAGFKFPASFGFTGSTGAYTNVQPYVRRTPRAFKDGGYVSETVGDQGHALVQRSRPYTAEDQDSGGRSPLRRGFKSGGKNFIKGAIKHPGALHAALGVPQGQKIPAKKMAKAAKSSSPLMRKRVALAKTLGKMHKADGGPVMGMPGTLSDADREYLKSGPLSTLNNMRKKPPRPPRASTVKERFAADGGRAIPSRTKDYSMMEGVRAIPALIRTGVGMLTDKMSSGQRTVEGNPESIDQRVTRDTQGKTMASNYARGGKAKSAKMKRMGYAFGGQPMMGIAPPPGRMQPSMPTMGPAAGARFAPPRMPMRGMMRSKGGMTRYAKGGSVSAGEAKKIAQATIGEHVRYPAPKGHKGLGAMLKK